MNPTFKRLAAMMAVVALAGLSAVSVALADNINNDIDAVGDYTISAGGSTTIGYKIVGTPVSTNDSQAGCNVSDGSPGVLTLTVPAGVTATGSTLQTGNKLTFSDCNPFQYVTFSSSTPGNYNITVSISDSGGGGYNNNADFTLIVGSGGTTPPTNHNPVVSDEAEDANGTEGTTLEASGAFTDEDGDALTLTADNGTVGTFTDNTNGTWSWSLPTDDDVTGGTIKVTASDGKGGTVTDEFTYSASNADPVLSALALTGSNCQPTLGFSFTDAGIADTHSGTIDWGDDSTDDTFTVSPVSKSHSYTSAGNYPIGVSVSDDNGGSDSDSATSHTVYNIPSGILQPINASGSRSAFKLGSTIPIKISVASCGGGSVGSLSPGVSLIKLDNTPDGSDMEVVSTANPTSGTTMRYDTTGQQYIYNLGTKNLSGGDYRVSVNDGSFSTPVTATFSIKK